MSQPVVEPGTQSLVGFLRPTVTYHLLACKECWPETDEAPQVFETDSDRLAWKQQHASTGHATFLQWDETRWAQ